MAIARDTSVNAGRSDLVTSKTWSHTCSGDNRILFVGVMALSGDYITGVTYNGVSMTLIAKNNPGTAERMYLYVLVNPASGANNVVASSTTSDYLYAGSASYTGAKQSSQPDSNTSNSQNSTTSYATSTTSVADNCWGIELVRCFSTSHNNVSVGANTSLVTKIFDALELVDNSSVAPKTPAGTITLTSTTVANTNWYSIMASFSPAVSNQANFLAFF